LVFVNEHVLKTVLIHRKHIGVLAKKLHNAHQQIVEVHGTGALEAQLVLDINIGVLTFKHS